MSTSEVQRNTSTQNWQELGATDTTQKSALHKGFVSGDGITGITYSAGTPASNAVTQTQVAEYLKSLTAINPNAITEDTAIEFFNAIESFGASITLSNEITQEDLNLAKQVEDLLKKPTISDFDIRELMKLLIKAFSQLLNSQRQVTLNTITNIITALKAKIADMEKSRDENYHAALASAIGGIVMGTLQVAGGVISAVGAFNAKKDIAKINGKETTELTSSTDAKQPASTALGTDSTTASSTSATSGAGETGAGESQGMGEILKQNEIKGIEANKDFWVTVGRICG
ncbi:MAG: hypothetical protein ACSW8C_03485, partial [bacterium]